MKKTLIVLSVCLAAWLCFWPAAANIPDPGRFPGDRGGILMTDAGEWRGIPGRTIANGGADTAWDLTTDALDFSTIVQSAANIETDNTLIDVRKTLGWGVNAVELAIYGNADNNDTFDIEIYAYRNSTYGPPVPVFSTTAGGCAYGTMVVLKDPLDGSTLAGHRWTDTISGTDHWDGVTVFDSGADQMARIMFDLRGYRVLCIKVTADTFDNGHNFVLSGY